MLPLFPNTGFFYNNFRLKMLLSECLEVTVLLL